MLMGRIQLYLAYDSSIKLGDIHWYRGDSFPIPLIVKQDGIPLDITGCSFIMTASALAAPPDTTDQIFEVTGVVVEGQDTNPGRMYLMPVDTDVASKPYHYDVQMIDSNGYIRTVAKNHFIILQDITKRTGGLGWDSIPDWDDVPDWDKLPGQD